MGCRFILGPAGSGKTAYCLESMAAAMARQPLGMPLVLVVPEQATFIHERQLATACGGGGFSRADVTSFHRLIHKAAREGGAVIPPSLSEAGKMLLLRRLLQNHRGELAAFQAPSLQSGFMRNLMSLAEEMQVYNVKPEQLADFSCQLQQQHPGSRFGDKLADTALLYGDYLNTINESYGGYPQGMEFLAKAIEKQGFLQGATVYIDGYYQFTPKEMQVIAALLRSAAHLEITLPLDAGQEEMIIGPEQVFYPAWHSYSHLVAVAREQHTVVEPPLLLRETAGRFRRGGELSMLERNLAAPGSISPSMVKPTAIRLFHATTRREELLGVGREIIRLTRDQGLRYRDIGVIIRATAPYEQLLPQIFGDLQIPYFLDSKKSLLYHPLIELVRATLENWAYQLRQENIFRYLKNPLSPLTLEQGDRLENYCLANGIKLWSWEKAEPWMGTRGLNPETAAAELQEIDQLRRLAAGALLEFCHSLGKKAQAAQIGRALRTLLERLAAEQKIAAWAKRAKLQGQGAEGELQQQVWACLQQFLAEAELLLQQTVLSPEEAIGVFDAAFQGLTISMIPPGLDEVFVSSLERSVNPPLQVAFVLNVNDTVLPQRIAAEGLFTEKERQQLAEAQITLAPNQRLRQLAENFLSYTALTRSGGLLYLSYVLRDEQGAACLPSPLVGQIKELFIALEEENYDQIALPELLTGTGADVAALAEQLSRKARGETIAPFWDGVAVLLREDARQQILVAQVERGLTFQAQTGQLSPKMNRRLTGEVLRGSVSRLEKFRSCPFGYFAAYSLGLQPRAQYRVLPADRGELFHQALADIGRELQRQDIPWQAVDQQLADDLSAQAMARYLPLFLEGILSSSARYRYLAERFCRALSATLLLAARHMQGGSFVPVAFELPFGRNEPHSLPPLRIDLPEGRKLLLSGQIDRVDMAQGQEKSWFRIVDYKTGKLNLTPQDIFTGLRLQLLVYLQVVLDNSLYFSAREAAAAGIYYGPVHDELINCAIGEQPPEAMQLLGITVQDPEAIKLADRDIDGYSKLIKVAYSEKKGFYANSPGVTPPQLQLLQQHLLRILRDTAGQMAEGIIAAQPMSQKGFLVCDFCDQQEFCGLDRDYAGIITVENPDKEQLWQILAGGAENEQL